MKLLKTLLVIFVFAMGMQSCAVGGGSHTKCAAYSQAIMDEAPESEEMTLNIEENEAI